MRARAEPQVHVTPSVHPFFVEFIEKFDVSLSTLYCLMENDNVTSESMIHYLSLLFPTFNFRLVVREDEDQVIVYLRVIPVEDDHVDTLEFEITRLSKEFRYSDTFEEVVKRDLVFRWYAIRY